MEEGSLPNHVNSYVLCVCMLFNFRLFTVIDLSLVVLSAQQVVSEQARIQSFEHNKDVKHKV